MNTIPIEKQFLRMGTRIKVQKPDPPTRGWFRAADYDYSLDVGRDRFGEHYVLSVPDEQRGELEATILQVRPDQKHLLLMVRKGADQVDRFLCGHDEREWFVAAVPDAVSTVADAKESLKPPAVRQAQVAAKLKNKERNLRKNRAFRRQGEWFFLPQPGLSFDSSVIHVWEPIFRSGGKPHMVQLLVRTQGENLYVCDRFPNGMRERQYQSFLAEKPGRKNMGWTVRQIDAQVFAKGEVRHLDHKTVVLDEWHEVLMNTENESRTMQNVAFID